MLYPYRVLDLTDEKGLFCGKLLADLGADVVLVEPPEGNACRRAGPFWKDTGDSEHSLLWWSLNTNKRSVTLNLESKHGQGLFLKLAEKADFVIESFPPGYLDKLGPGYTELAARNPGLILVSISPFGQTGPHCHYQTSDLVAMAMGGVMFATGDPDRPPVRPYPEQAYLMAGLHAAAAALTALSSRAATGQGQWLDISIHECLLVIASTDVIAWDFQKIMPRRMGSTIVRAGYQARAVWPCKDGLISFRIGGGSAGEGVRTLVEWMDSTGQAGNLKGFSFEPAEIQRLSLQERHAQEEVFGRFFLEHTKAEIFEEAVKRGFFVQPAFAIGEILADPQLRSRGFWHDVEHPELDGPVTYPGVPLGPTFPKTEWRRAPRIGEHNIQVFHGELGFSQEELSLWRGQGVI